MMLLAYSMLLISRRPGSNFDEDLKDCDTYLLPDYEEYKKIENWLKRNFDKLFTEQLNGWYLDETLWPENRTFKMFKEWFEYTICTIVWDLGTDPIEKT